MARVDIRFPANLAQVATVSDLRAVPSYDATNKMLFVVINAGRAYSWDPGSLAADDGANVIRPLDLSPIQAGRWLFQMEGFAPGPPGTSDNTYTNLPAFKASDVGRKKASVAGIAGVPDGDFFWTLGDYSATPADQLNVNVIKADSASLSVGAWVRQSADAITGAARAIYPERLSIETDDTLAFRRWIAADGLHTLRAERDSADPYILSPFGPQDIIVPLIRGFLIEGNDAVVKIKDGSGGYFSIFGQKDGVADLSGIVIRNVEFDHNIQNCPAPSISGGLLVSPRATLAVKKCNGGWFVDNIVRNSVCTNAIAFNGDGNTSDCHADRNQFINIGSALGDQYHDHSTLYLTGDNITMDDNDFSAVFGSAGSVCAIETHPGTTYSVSRNKVRGFHTGINIAGVYDFDTVDGTVVGNQLDCLRRGIALYSGVYLAHTTGYGLDRLLIDGNVIRIRNATSKGFMTGGGPGAFGISFVSGTTLPVRDVTIAAANTVTFDLEMAQADWDSIPIGAGIGQSGGLGEAGVYENVRIGPMTITNCPGIGIVMGIGGAILKNCVVDRPTLVRPGSAFGTAFNGAYRAGLWVAPKAYQGTFRASIAVVDDLPTARLNRAIVIGGTDDSTATSSSFDFDLTITGARTDFVATVQKDTNPIFPRITGEQNFPFSAPAALVLSNSLVRDRVSNVGYRTLALSSAWSRLLRGMGPPAGIYEDNAEYVNDGAAAGEVSGYISKGGAWKPLTTIGA